MANSKNNVGRLPAEELDRRSRICAGLHAGLPKGARVPYDVLARELGVSETAAGQWYLRWLRGKTGSGAPGKRGRKGKEVVQATVAPGSALGRLMGLAKVSPEQHQARLVATASLLGFDQAIDTLERKRRELMEAV